MSNNSPDLRFGPGSNQGFTGVGVATFDNLHPAAVVRELVQNALDAALMANVKPAVVLFRLSEINREEIPGINSYQHAFKEAVKTQRQWTDGSLAGQAELAVNRIERSLKQEKLDVLSVFDNGIGLDEQRMNALLSDGLSVKSGNTAGTYGNGHATAIPASDLRYVLYGGLTESGSRIGAGHAVLASHLIKGNSHMCSGDGFYIRDFNAGIGTLYSYPSGEDLDRLIADAVDDIARNSKHGSAIIIPAFNNFLERDPLWKMVFHAASANFFVAIEDGELEVTVEDVRQHGNDQPKVLNKSTLSEVLRKFSNKQRTKAFLNGHRAFEAHRAYHLGKKHTIKTAAGNIDVRLHKTMTGIHRIDLCRNGMWITHDKKIRSFYQKFVEKEPFQAVLSLEAEEGRRLYKFIRDAEGPLHDSIEIKRLPRQDQVECIEALKEVVDWILRNTDSVKTEEFVADDFLTLDFGDEGGKGTGRLRRGFRGAPVAITRNPLRQPLFSEIIAGTSDGDPDLRSKGKKRRKNPKRNVKRERGRPALPIFFQATSCPAGKNRRRILIECSRDFANAELRFVVDEALDATCERHGQDRYTPAVLSDVTINGNPASESDYIRWNEGVIGVRLGDLKANDSITIEADCQVTGDFIDLPTPSLRAEVLKSEQPTSMHTGTN